MNRTPTIYLILILISSFHLFAQSLDSDSIGVSVKKDSIFVQNDSTSSDRINSPVKYHSKDSMIFDLTDKSVKLFGDSRITYEDISLTSDNIQYKFEFNLVEARSTTIDSTHKVVGEPIFKNGNEVFETEWINYNFSTKKAFIKGIVTENNGAFIHGNLVKKTEDNELYIKKGRYTTCNLKNPHFFIQSNKLKVIQKDKKIVSGPLNIKFRDLPTPIFLPFGIFPQQKTKSSGIIFPTFGEEQRRGFFLRNAGYYFAINDYIDLKLTGDIFSKGGSSLRINSSYKKKYGYNGSFSFSYSNNVTSSFENDLNTTDYWVIWNHSPISFGKSSFSANVSLGSQTYNTNQNLVVENFQRSISSQFSSSISYNTRFRATPFSMSVRLAHNQNTATKIVNLTLPDLSFMTTRVYPFKNADISSKSPLAKLSFSHTFNSSFRVSNSRSGSFPFKTVGGNNSPSEPLDFNGDNFQKIASRTVLGGVHRIPISTSISAFKHFNLNPSINFNEYWYAKELSFNYSEKDKAVKVDTLQKFSRGNSWSFHTSLQTVVYGTFFFKNKRIKALRHTMTPNLSINYTPNLKDPKYGVFQTVQIDSLGRTYEISKFHGFPSGGPSGSESFSMGFSVTNTFEMKLLTKKDTSEQEKKVKIFDNIGFSGGYDFLRDSLNLSNISINARTNIFKGLIFLNFSGSLDPYMRNPKTNTRINQFTWNNGKGLGQLTSMSTSIGIQLSPSTLKNKPSYNKNEIEKKLGKKLSEEEHRILQRINNNPNLYIDFNIPWTLSINYGLNRTKNGFQDVVISQSLSFNGSLSLSKNTKISFNSGYDFEANKFTNTRLSFSRNLHCWTMSLNWVPFGRYQTYSFTINAKSSFLQDLKIEKRRSFYDLSQ